MLYSKIHRDLVNIFTDKKTYFPLYDTDRIENDTSSSYIFAYIFVATVTLFTGPLPIKRQGVHI
jgi:hypothetical protein